jgi:hypothetical protein
MDALVMRWSALTARGCTTRGVREVREAVNAPLL